MSSTVQTWQVFVIKAQARAVDKMTIQFFFIYIFCENVVGTH